MPKHRILAKGCPKCDQQVPVACKSCPCGHSFFDAKRIARALSPGEDIRRRTRVQREKPNYYDALEYDKQTRRAKQRRASECEDEEKKESTKRKRRRSKKEDEEEDDRIAALTPAKQLLCSIILSELNRKLQVVTWKPT